MVNTAHSIEVPPHGPDELGGAECDVEVLDPEGAVLWAEAGWLLVRAPPAKWRLDADPDEGPNLTFGRAGCGGRVLLARAAGDEPTSGNAWTRVTGAAAASRPCPSVWRGVSIAHTVPATARIVTAAAIGTMTPATPARIPSEPSSLLPTRRSPGAVPPG
jgi:hypothetical protein